MLQLQQNNNNTAAAREIIFLRNARAVIFVYFVMKAHT